MYLILFWNIIVGFLQHFIIIAIQNKNIVFNGGILFSSLKATSIATITFREFRENAIIFSQFKNFLFTITPDFINNIKIYFIENDAYFDLISFESLSKYINSFILMLDDSKYSKYLSLEFNNDVSNISLSILIDIMALLISLCVLFFSKFYNSFKSLVIGNIISSILFSFVIFYLEKKMHFLSLNTTKTIFFFYQHLIIKFIIYTCFICFIDLVIYILRK